MASPSRPAGAAAGAETGPAVEGSGGDRLAVLDRLRIPRDAAPPAPRRGRWLLAAAALVLAAAGAGFWAAGRPPAVRTAAVRALGAEGPAGVLEASGYVVARRRATVSSELTGRLAAVLAQEGSRVEEGQVLARLDDSMARRELALAEAQVQAVRGRVRERQVLLAEAEQKLARSRWLEGKGVLAQAVLDEDESAVSLHRAALAALWDEVQVAARAAALRREGLEHLVIRAPFAGVVVSRDAQVGEIVSPVTGGGGFTRTGVCTLVDMGSLEVEVDVNEAYIQRVRPGQGASILADAYPDRPFPGRVVATIPAADRQKATVRVRVAILGDLEGILPDMGVKVVFLDEDGEAAAPAGPPRLFVPRSAVVEREGRPVVFRVADGQVERTAVELGRSRGDLVEVLAGVAAGQEIVIDGHHRLAGGETVRRQEDDHGAG